MVRTQGVMCKQRRNWYSLISVAFLLACGARCLETDHSVTSAGDTEIEIDLVNLSIDEIVRQLTVRRVCCADLTRYFLQRIEEYNPILKAAVTVDEVGSLQDAEKLDDYYKKTGGALVGRLHCVPTFIKDNIFVKGLPTTLGIRLFSNAIADEDAPAVAKLKKEGAIILGKANMIMFAAGAIDVGSETGGLARNPYAYNYTVVGSSTGNAVMLAARLAVIGLGSDSGGSITSPASATHVVGLRPPSGAVDMRNVFPLLGQPFDTIGPMAVNVKDIITIMDILQDGGNRAGEDFDRPTIRLGILNSLAYGAVNLSSSLLDSTGFSATTTYSVDPEIQECFRTFETRLDTLSQKYDVTSTLILDDVIKLARPVLENEDHRWSCVASHMTRFLRRRPMLAVNDELISSADEIASNRATPLYYRSLLSHLSKRTNSCPASRQRYRRNLSTVRRRLQRQIFDNNIDVVVMPTLNALPWPLAKANSGRNRSPYPHSNGLLQDLGGLFALPALNLPLCFSTPRLGAPQGLPIGGYFMTVPDRLSMMLEFGRIYEEEFKDRRLPRLVLP